MAATGKDDDKDNNKEPIIVAAVEGGGTTFVVAVARIQQEQKIEILVRAEIDSSHDQPHETLEECAAFFRQHLPDDEGYHALGIACFGPLGVKPDDPATYGTILGSSPKAHWRNVNVLEPLQRACQGGNSSRRKLQVLVDTDVNAPALAEYIVAKANSNKNISSLAYITCGTGVGVGLVIHGHCVHGRMHPEGGHVPVKPLPNDDFPGYSWGGSSSPFAGVHTVEGIASSVALTERLEWTQRSNGNENNNHTNDRSILRTLPDDHEVWDHAANALANLCVTLLLTTSMERIVLGGGIMQRSGLLEKIQSQTRFLLNGYLELPAQMSELIGIPHYGNAVGLMGAILLAKSAHETKSSSSSSEFLVREKKRSLPGFGEGMVVGMITALGAMTAISFFRTSRGANK
mmetsp:Transcript_19294/g.28543  ORF Transcript_19294/g.28543 Transcript_19294/m.28543 type:complete len:403 (+) Transcript_19294:15-1223(+)